MIGLLELERLTEEELAGITGGKAVDRDTVANGKVIGGEIPGVIVGGLVRSGEDALGTKSKNT